MQGPRGHQNSAPGTEGSAAKDGAQDKAFGTLLLLWTLDTTASCTDNTGHWVQPRSLSSPNTGMDSARRLLLLNTSFQIRVRVDVAPWQVPSYIVKEACEIKPLMLSDSTQSTCSAQRKGLQSLDGQYEWHALNFPHLLFFCFCRVPPLWQKVKRNSKAS